MMFIKLQHFAFIAFADIPAARFRQARGGTGKSCRRSSNYQRNALRAAGKEGCFKAGQEPFDSSTFVMRSWQAPITLG